MGGRPEEVFVSALRRLLSHSQRILDIGTPQRFAKELRKYEPWFAGKEYIAAGFKPSMMFGDYNCDIHQDIEQMSFGDSEFDAAICIEVIEHVQNPFKATFEIRRVLKPGGVLLLTAPFLYSYHGKGSSSHQHGSYPDYWRFTHEGLERLFIDFNNIEIYPLDGPIEFRMKQFYLSPFLGMPWIRRLVDRVDRPGSGRATTRHLVFAKK